MSTTVEVLAPTTVGEVQEAVANVPRLLPRGGGSKTGLSTPDAGENILDISALSGLLEYEPGEFTFTALAGTPVETVRAALAEHGQYLPFDPPLAMAGATLGGTVAAGLSGSGTAALRRRARFLARRALCGWPGTPGARRRQGRQKRGRL